MSSENLKDRLLFGSFLLRQEQELSLSLKTFIENDSSLLE